MGAEERERADRRLRSLTAWLAGVSAALVGIFAAVAALTAPGTSDAAAAAPTEDSGVLPPTDAPAPTAAPVQVEPPASLPVAAPPAQPHARSGGSSHR